MGNKNILHVFFFFLSGVIFYGCQQKTTNKGLNVSSKTIAKEKQAIIYRSIDMGSTWTSFAKGIPKDATLSGIQQYENKIYVTTDYHGVFITSNGENNWTALGNEQLKGLDINCIEIEGNRIVIGTLNNGVFISNDNGNIWGQAQNNIKHVRIRAFIKFKNKLYAGTDSGIFESVDFGNTWVHVFGKMQILGFTSLNDKIYAAAQNGALVCDGNAKSWKYIYDGDALHDIGNDGKYIYAMTIGQQLLKTKNDGILWENAQKGIAYPTNFYTNEVQHIGENIFSAQWIGIYRSSDNGNNWKILQDLPDSTAFSTLEVTDFGIITGISIR